MQTWNGTGTMLYSWRSTSTGERTAMKWFTIMFVPVLPLERYQLRVLDRGPQGFFSGMDDDYEIFQRGPVDWREARGTWGALLRGLTVVALPWIAFFAILSYSTHRRELGHPHSLALGLGVVASLILAAVLTIKVPLGAIRRSRG